jgi:hypothetical protein
MAAPSSTASPLPTAWLAPPPGLLPSAHKATIEPASIVVSAVLATCVIIFVFLIFNRSKKSDYPDNSAGPKEAHRQPEISRPIAIDTVDTRPAHPPISRVASSSASRWPVTQPWQALDRVVERPRPVELADRAVRRPTVLQNPPTQQFNGTLQAPSNQKYNNTRQTQNIPQSPIELEVCHPAPLPTHQHSTFLPPSPLHHNHPPIDA